MIPINHLLHFNTIKISSGLNAFLLLFNKPLYVYMLYKITKLVQHEEKVKSGASTQDIVC